MRALVMMLVALATPAAGQVYTSTSPLPTGVVKLEAPPGVMVLVPGQLSKTEALLSAGAQLVVIRSWGVELTFWEYGTLQEVTGEPTMDIGDRLALCAFITQAGQRVAVDRGCECIAPELPVMWPGGVTYSSDDPAIASVDRIGNLCGGS